MLDQPQEEFAPVLQDGVGYGLSLPVPEFLLSPASGDPYGKHEIILFLLPSGNSWVEGIPSSGDVEDLQKTQFLEVPIYLIY